MNSPSAWMFATFVCLLAIRIWATPAARALGFMAASIVFLGLFAGSYAAAWLTMAFTALAYAALAFARAGRAALTASVGMLVIAFLVLKTFPGIGASIHLPVAAATIGLSYILFRSIHVMVDYHDHAIASRPSPVAFASYTLSFLTLLSGPIQRYEHFCESPFFAEAGTPSWDDVGAAIVRTTSGTFKVLVISALFSTAQSHALVALDGAESTCSRVGYLTAAALAFVVYLYANFSGYVDIVIGLGRITGFRLPENFNDPFRAVNIQDFWSRWHITLSDWVRVYVFNPMLRWSSTQLPSRRGSNVAGLASVFTAFFIIGVWHSQTTIGLVYGIALGVGATVHRLYGLSLRALLGKRAARRVGENSIHLRLSQGLTLSFFALSVICLWPDRAALLRLGMGRSALLLAAALVLLTAVTALCFAIDAPLRRTARSSSENDLPRDYRVQTIITTGQLTVVIFVRIVMAIPAPGFVYQAY